MGEQEEINIEQEDVRGNGLLRIHSEQLSSLICGFGKLEGRRKSMLSGYLGIKRLMRK